MSEYEGPVYQKQNQKPVNQRRFNFQGQKAGTKRVFKADTAREQTASSYELPNRTKQLDVKEELSVPVDIHQLNQRIEGAKLTDELVKKESYQVPFLTKTEENSAKVFEQTEPEVHLPKVLKEFQKMKYQPAFQAPIETTNEPALEKKSLENKLIREVAMRLSKPKDSYLLFEDR